MPRARAPFAAGRLWLDFVNTDEAPRHAQPDAFVSFDGYLAWLEAAGLLDPARRISLARRAVEQPASATAALHEARRIRSALRPLAERGRHATERVTQAAVLEINRVLGRSTGVRRIAHDARDGSFPRPLGPGGEAFATLVIPVVESAADALV